MEGGKREGEREQWSASLANKDSGRCVSLFCVRRREETRFTADRKTETQAADWLPVRSTIPPSSDPSSCSVASHPFCFITPSHVKTYDHNILLDIWDLAASAALLNLKCIKSERNLSKGKTVNLL